MFHPHLPSSLFTVIVLTICVGLSGCGESKLPQYSISGKITFDGKPVPTGSVKFEPVTEDGNYKTTVVEYKDGSYSASGENGIFGGKYKIVVFGYDGVPYEGGEGTIDIGKELFPSYTMEKELEAKEQTLDIEVPATSE